MVKSKNENGKKNFNAKVAKIILGKMAKIVKIADKKGKNW